MTTTKMIDIEQYKDRSLALDIAELRSVFENVAACSSAVRHHGPWQAVAPEQCICSPTQKCPIVAVALVPAPSSVLPGYAHLSGDGASELATSTAFAIAPHWGDWFTTGMELRCAEMSSAPRRLELQIRSAPNDRRPPMVARAQWCDDAMDSACICVASASTIEQRRALLDASRNLVLAPLSSNTLARYH